MARAPTLQDAIAVHRFGLGGASLDVTHAEPRQWLLTQIGPAEPARGEGLLDTMQALELVKAEVVKRRLAKNPPAGMTAQDILGGHYRAAIAADIQSRLLSAASATRPFAERLHLFWTNHFTVSLTKGAVRGLAGAFERDAIRPHIAGRFEDLLFASTTHPAMLRYLDNVQSAGPHSRAVRVASRRAERRGEEPRLTGLNENLAREVLELHTLGARSGYTQSDVTAFAAVLTGWRVGPRFDGGAPFDPAWHEPGPKTVRGRRYPEGPDALRMVLHDLARQPATARFLASKLVRHIVADDPPPALVDRLAATYLDAEGELAPVYRALVEAPEAWQAPRSKLKTPEEFVVSTARMLGLAERMFERKNAAGLFEIGQRPHMAPSPAGWSDRADDWLGPDAVWKRVEWSWRLGNAAGRRLDARAIAASSLGPALTDASREQIDRAADGPQALALLLMSPDFQRR